MKTLKRIFRLSVLVLLLASCAKEEELPEMLVINVDKVSVSGKGGNVFIEVTSSHEWECRNDASWISAEKTDAGIRITVDANNEGKSRQSRLVISSGTLSESIVLTQLSYGFIKTDTDVHELSAEGGQFTVEVNASSGSSYSVKLSDEWIIEESDDSEKNIHTFSVAPNDTYEKRTGYVIFEMLDFADTVFVEQHASSAFFINDDELHISEEGGEYTVELNTTETPVSCSLSEGVDWISILETKSLHKVRIVFDAERNDTGKERVAEITMTAPGTEMSEVLTIYQAAAPSVYKVLHNNLNFDIPFFDGEGMSGTVDWGDGGQLEEYSVYMTHHYDEQAEHEVTISSRNETSFRLDDIVGVSKLSL